jgi:hypothetical protein
VVNNMRAIVDVLPYDDHDRAVKLLQSLDRTVWGGKFEAIVESEKYDTLTVNELFSKLKSAEVDRGWENINRQPEYHQVKCYNDNPCACGPLCDRVFYHQTFPSSVT